MDTNAIKAAAHALRARFGLSDELRPDLQSVLGKLAEVFPNTEVKIVPETDAPALAWTDSRNLYVQARIYEGLAHDNVHARYVVAHELAHLALRHSPSPSRFASQSKRRDWQKLELEAAVFANEFLAPFYLVARYEDVKEAKTRAAIKQASLSRISELSTLDRFPLAPTTRADADVVNELIALGYTEGEISGLVVPQRTLARRRADREALTVEETDKALRLGRIARLAGRVFGDLEKAYRWLRKPKRGLNGQTPVAFLASEEGARKVEEMLYRIDHGMAA